MPLHPYLCAEGACYTGRAERDYVVMFLLRMAHKLMAQATIVRRLHELEAIRDSRFPLQESFEFLLSIDPPFLDSFRIATAYENLLKAELLSFGYLIHEIDHKAAATATKRIGEKQRNQPITIAEFRTAEGLSRKQKWPQQIRSLTTKTVPFGRILRTDTYTNPLRLSQSLRQALIEVQTHRNSAHCVVFDTCNINAGGVARYRLLRDAFNSRLLPRYQRLMERYNLPVSSPVLALAAV